MLKKIRIQNFKCYDSPQDFELSLINLIYGNNSVGKSTFLQAISMISKSYLGNRGGQCLRERSTTYKGKGFSEADKNIWKLRVCSIDETDEQVWKLTPKDVDAGALSGSEQATFLLLDEDNNQIGANEFGKYILGSVHEEAQTGREQTGFQSLGDALTQTQIDWINTQFEKLKLGYRCVDTTSLYDTDLNYGPIPLPDVGAGIRGLFRYLKALARWESGILLLEEPESHVNEDQFGAWIEIMVSRTLELKNSGADAQLVVECHNELMYIKTLMMVRGAVLTPHELGIFYLKKTEAGTSSEHCSVDGNGRLLKWGHKDGFFNAKNKILFGNRR